MSHEPSLRARLAVSATARKAAGAGTRQRSQRQEHREHHDGHGEPRKELE